MLFSHFRADVTPDMPWGCKAEGTTCDLICIRLCGVGVGGAALSWATCLLASWTGVCLIQPASAVPVLNPCCQQRDEGTLAAQGRKHPAHSRNIPGLCHQYMGFWPFSRFFFQITRKWSLALLTILLMPALADKSGMVPCRIMHRQAYLIWPGVIMALLRATDTRPRGATWRCQSGICSQKDCSPSGGDKDSQTDLKLIGLKRRVGWKQLAELPGVMPQRWKTRLGEGAFPVRSFRTGSREPSSEQSDDSTGGYISPVVLGQADHMENYKGLFIGLWNALYRFELDRDLRASF